MTSEMPPLLGVGCDVEELARLREVLERDPHFLERWFRPAERAAVAQAADPVGLSLCLFCLKEAAIKAVHAALAIGPDSVEALPDGEQGWSVVLPGHPGYTLEAEAALADGWAWARVAARRHPT